MVGSKSTPESSTRKSSSLPRLFKCLTLRCDLRLSALGIYQEGQLLRHYLYSIGVHDARVAVPLC